jgi:hypothetical protein
MLYDTSTLETESAVNNFDRTASARRRGHEHVQTMKVRDVSRTDRKYHMASARQAGHEHAKVATL